MAAVSPGQVTELCGSEAAEEPLDSSHEYLLGLATRHKSKKS